MSKIDPSTTITRPTAEITRDNHPAYLDAFKAVVTSRRAVKRFTDTPIPDDVLQDCLDLALVAPSSSNLQPWQFIVIKSPDIRKQADKLCMGQNAAKTAAVLIAVIARTDTWKKHTDEMVDYWPVQPAPKIVKNYYQKLVPAEFTKGPLSVLAPFKWAGVRAARQFKGAIAEPQYTEADTKLWAVKSTSLAAQNLMLAFKAYGFDSCPMGGFDEPAMKKLLGLGKHQHICMMIGAGERAQNGIYHPQFRFERTRFIKEV